MQYMSNQNYLCSDTMTNHFQKLFQGLALHLLIHTSANRPNKGKKFQPQYDRAILVPGVWNHFSEIDNNETSY